MVYLRRSASAPLTSIAAATDKRYQSDLSSGALAGIDQPEQFRIVTRAHLQAWRRDLETRALAGATIRRKLAALSSLFEYLCEANAVVRRGLGPSSARKRGGRQRLYSYSSYGLGRGRGSGLGSASRIASTAAAASATGSTTGSSATVATTGSAARLASQTLSW